MENKIKLHENLERLIGNCNSSYYKYLIYSSNLTHQDGITIIKQIKHEIDNNAIKNNEELYQKLKEYFNEQNEIIQKEKKIESLDELFSEENYFFSDLKKKYHLNRKEINDIKDLLVKEINKCNLNDYEIKVHLEMHFKRRVSFKKQKAKVNNCSKNNYDNDFIKNLLNIYPNIDLNDDIIPIFKDINKQIENGVEFDNIELVIQKKINNLSTLKIVYAQEKLDDFILFNNIFDKYELPDEIFDKIIENIYLDINQCKITSKKITEEYIELKCKEYDRD